MVRVKKTLTQHTPRIHTPVNRSKPEVHESPLLLMRLKELDEEFIRQTKHLTEATRKIKNKWRQKF